MTFALAFGVFVGTTAMPSPAAAETQKVGSSGLQENTFYAYVRAGETLTVSGPLQATAPDGSVSGPGTLGPATSDGVWILQTTPDAQVYHWEVTANAADGTPILGRVWSNMYTMTQIGQTDLQDYQWWVLNDTGYRYQITTNGYNGILSRIRANSVGFTAPGTCDPLYASVENTTGDWNPVTDCGDAYRVFFESPAADLPASAPSADGIMTIAPALLEEDDLAATALQFTSADDGTVAGTLSYALDPRFSGSYLVQVDVNGNGSYEDPEDRTERLGTDGSGEYTYDFDGLDAAGAEIGICTPVTARLAFDRLGEVHVLQDDVEGRTGGIEIIRENGPGSPDATIYWDDTQLVRPAGNTTPVLDGTAGVDSSGGVHGWDFLGNSWGGVDRGIDDWSYVASDATTEGVSLTAASNDCLAVEKSSDFTESSRVGDTITYTVSATNTGEVDFTTDNPAVVLDELSTVLDDADYNNDAATSTGEGVVSYEEPLLSWTGPLAAGATVELTYTVTLTPGGDREVTNVAWSPDDPEVPTPPTCDPRDADGRDPVTGEPCAIVSSPLPRLQVEKSADFTEIPAVGETVTYTVTATNVGPGVYTTGAPATVVDDLNDVLDDATFVDGSLTTSIGEAATFDGERLRWSGALGVDEALTMTYQVTYTGAGDALLTNVAWEPNDPGEEAPECSPRNADGTDPVTGEPCGFVAIPAAILDVTKDVDPADGSTVLPGEQLTYTIAFNSTGTAAAAVDGWIDDLSGVIDDAEIISAPVASNAALEISELDNGQFVVNGSVPAGLSYMVTYTVEVLPDGERGDDVLSNVVFQDGTTPPTDCIPGDPLCTENFVPGIIESKSSDPESGTTVVSGDEVTYTLTFENIGQAAAVIDFVDHMAGVLDDAQLIGAVETTGGASSAGPVDGQLMIGGTVQPGETATVVYTVAVEDYDDQGDHHLGNFLTLSGQVPPSECLESNPLCTEHPIAPVADSALPDTGSDVAPWMALTALLLLGGGGAVLIAQRKRQLS